MTVLLGSLLSSYPDFIENVKIPEDREFNSKYHQVFFKTPLAVNMCTEAFLGPTFTSIKDFAVGQVVSQLLTFGFLLPSIRERGGAYGAGCSLNESGIMNLYSFRDPNITKTYENFDIGLKDVISGNFTQ